MRTLELCSAQPPPAPVSGGAEECKANYCQNFTFENKHYSLSDKARDEKRTIFKNLKIIIIDEVSMVKSDMLYQLDLKLQELKERVGVPFGGVSILVFGDMLQLRPVMGSYIFEKPRNQEFHATFRMDNRWEKFAIINLEEKSKSVRRQMDNRTALLC